MSVYPVYATIGGIKRLVIGLHYPDLVRSAEAELAKADSWDEVAQIKMCYSEGEFLRETLTNTHIQNGIKGAKRWREKIARRTCWICNKSIDVRLLDDNDVCMECAGNES